MSKQLIRIGEKDLTLTNLDKLWWEEEGIRKAEVVKYFSDVAEWLLPHLLDRPLVLTRYPDGWQGKSFYQKNLPEHAPPWIRSVAIPGERRVIHYMVAEDVADLVWLANQAAFEFHPFLSRIGALNNPDYVVFDLDPMEKTQWADVRQAALAVRAALEYWGLRAYPKTSGGDGLQIFLPLTPQYSYEDVREFALAIMQAVNEVMPEITTLIRSPRDRGGRLYLDYLQNVKGKTLVSVYAIRPRPKATVSAPVTWEEIEGDLVRNESFTLRTILPRLQRAGDLFAGVLRDKQDIGKLLSAPRR
jgi:bifunctional non-homologous end joining protein LigD